MSCWAKVIQIRLHWSAPFLVVSNFLSLSLSLSRSLSMIFEWKHWQFNWDFCSVIVIVNNKDIENLKENKEKQTSFGVEESCCFSWFSLQVSFFGRIMIETSTNLNNTLFPFSAWKADYCSSRVSPFVFFILGRLRETQNSTQQVWAKIVRREDEKLIKVFCLFWIYFRGNSAKIRERKYSNFYIKSS